MTGIGRLLPLLRHELVAVVRRSSPTVDPALRTEIQLQMRNAFYCESADWQAAVYGRIADFIYRACRGLATSSSP